MSDFFHKSGTSLPASLGMTVQSVCCFFMTWIISFAVLYICTIVIHGWIAHMIVDMICSLSWCSLSVWWVSVTQPGIMYPLW